MMMMFYFAGRVPEAVTLNRRWRDCSTDNTWAVNVDAFMSYAQATVTQGLCCAAATRSLYPRLLAIRKRPANLALIRDIKITCPSGLD